MAEGRKRGPRVIHFPLHPAHKIAVLAADSSMVAAWRKADSQHTLAGRSRVL